MCRFTVTAEVSSESKVYEYSYSMLGMNLEIGEAEIPIRHARTETYHYELEMSIDTEETIDTEKHKIISHSFHNLLKDVDPDSLGRSGLSKDMRRRMLEGGSLSPRSRKDVTNELIRAAVSELIDEIDYNIVKVRGIRVNEETTIREEEFKQGGYDVR